MTDEQRQQPDNIEESVRQFDIANEIGEAVRIVSEHQTDCEKIESGLYPCNPLPRHSHTAKLFLAMRMLAFEYVQSSKGKSACIDNAEQSDKVKE